jgi:uncharacterized protein DUF6941
VDVGFIILADHGEAISGKVYILGGGWNMLNLPDLPQEWAFAIVVGLDVSWDETNQRHKFALHIEGPDGDRLGDQLLIDLEAGRPPGSLAGQDQRVTFSLVTRLTFEQAGPHAVVVRIGEQEIGRARFYVVEHPQAPAPSPIAPPG